MTLEVCPRSLLDSVEAELSSMLHQIIYQGDTRRCLATFSQEDGYFQYRPSLCTDPTWQIFFARTDHGLMGKCIVENDIVHWGGDDSDVFSRGDPRTVFEIAAPIQFKDKPIGVLLVDFFEDENYPQSSGEIAGLRAAVNQWTSAIEEKLESADREHDRIRGEVYRITELCFRDTKSLRGYTAIKGWDGRVQYFPQGRDVKRFLLLNQLEGICGEVFRTGKLLNVGNVWKHPHYVPSDELVMSEIVAPILSDGEVIGVLNMESRVRDHYSRQKVESVQHYARLLSEFAESIRQPHDSTISEHSRLLSDLVESLNVVQLAESLPRDKIVEWVFEILEQKIKRAVEPKRIRMLQYRGNDETKVAIYKQSFDSGKEYHLERDGNGWNLCLPLKDGAFTYAVIEVETDEKPTGTHIDVLVQFCRIGENEIRRRTEEIRSAAFESVLHNLHSGDSREKLFELLRDMKFIFDCDHVTYFEVHIVQGRNVLLPICSTAFDLRYIDDRKFYYIREDDGFTGFSGTRNKITVIQNADDQIELRKIHPQLSWKGRISEEDRAEIRSFFAIPVHSEGKIKGLLRGHRSARSTNIPFSSIDYRRMETIKMAVENTLDLELEEA